MTKNEFDDFLSRNTFMNQLIYKEDTLKTFLYVGMLLHINRNPKVSIEKLSHEFEYALDLVFATVMRQIQESHPKKTQYCKKKIDIEKFFEVPNYV